MAGVIDSKGQQWEHCNCCAKMFRFPQNLGYQKPNKELPNGRDLCVTCVDKALRARTVRFSHIVPASDWKRVIVTA